MCCGQSRPSLHPEFCPAQLLVCPGSNYLWKGANITVQERAQLAQLMDSFIANCGNATYGARSSICIRRRRRTARSQAKVELLGLRHAAGRRVPLAWGEASPPVRSPLSSFRRLSRFSEPQASPCPASRRSRPVSAATTPPTPRPSRPSATYVSPAPGARPPRGPCCWQWSPNQATRVIATTQARACAPLPRLNTGIGGLPGQCNPFGTSCCTGPNQGSALTTCFCKVRRPSGSHARACQRRQPPAQPTVHHETTATPQQSGVRRAASRQLPAPACSAVRALHPKGQHAPAHHPLCARPRSPASAAPRAPATAPPPATASQTAAAARRWSRPTAPARRSFPMAMGTTRAGARCAGRGMMS